MEPAAGANSFQPETASARRVVRARNAFLANTCLLVPRVLRPQTTLLGVSDEESSSPVAIDYSSIFRSASDESKNPGGASPWSEGLRSDARTGICRGAASRCGGDHQRRSARLFWIERLPISMAGFMA